MSKSIYKNKAFQMRKELMEKFYVLKEGHPGSVFSIMDVLIVLYYGKFLRIRKKNNIYLPIDDLIISKGHATVGQYPILKDLLVIKKKEWNNWGIKKSFLKMFGNIEIPGIKTATGSLGHGIGFGTGIAFYAKKNKIKKEVYVIISEGELYEGSTWESLLLLSSLKLDNLTIASPDMGGSKRAYAYSKFLKSDVVICYKQREKANIISHMELIGNVEGKNVVLVDDMVDTAGTLTKAADLMIERGALSVRAICTHAILSGNAYEKIENSKLEELIVTDSIPSKINSPKVRVLSCSKLFAEVMMSVSSNKSISTNFLM